MGTLGLSSTLTLQWFYLISNQAQQQQLSLSYRVCVVQDEQAREKHGEPRHKQGVAAFDQRRRHRQARVPG